MEANRFNMVVGLGKNCVRLLKGKCSVAIHQTELLASSLSPICMGTWPVGDESIWVVPLGTVFIPSSQGTLTWGGRTPPRQLVQGK